MTDTTAPMAQDLPDLTPSACEYGRNNGDGTYSPVYDRWPLPAYERPHPDCPVTLFVRAGAAAAAIAQLDARIRELEAALRRTVNSLPTKADMRAAGWDATEIEEAMAAHQEATAALAAAPASGNFTSAGWLAIGTNARGEIAAEHHSSEREAREAARHVATDARVSPCYVPAHALAAAPAAAPRQPLTLPAKPSFEMLCAIAGRPSEQMHSAACIEAGERYDALLALLAPAPATGERDVQG